jgi:hypothetical protein
MTFRHPIITSVTYLILLVSAVWNSSYLAILLAVAYITVEHLVTRNRNKLSDTYDSLYSSYKGSKNGRSTGGLGPR